MTTNTKDSMNDVFPVTFTFKQGEQPDANKLTGLVNQTNLAFSRLTSVIGDPWEYAVHKDSAELSPERLAQINIARILGPSDYLSPQGGCWNENTTTQFQIKLQPYRTQWNIGFPLLKKKVTPPNITESNDSTLIPYEWLEEGEGDFFIETNTYGLDRTKRKTSIDQLVEPGQWHIDFEKGIVTSFSAPTSTTTITIKNITMLGAAVPWGTANIIPSWEQTVGLCTLGERINEEYILTLPLVDVPPRVNVPGNLNTFDSGGNSTVITTNVYGKGSKHRLPLSITSKFQTGDLLPEGTFLLWDDFAKRIVPLISFKYIDPYSVKIIDAPVGLLTPESNSSYRLIAAGTTTAEAISFLLAITRENTHKGLELTQDSRTVYFGKTLSHSDLANTYAGFVWSGTEYKERYRVTQSKMPSNDHPQYLHRAGFVSADKDLGNTCNAMRGDLVIAGEFDSVSQIFPINHDGGGTSGCRKDTYSLTFGGKAGEFTDTDCNPGFRFEGGEDVNTWASGTAHRLGFGIQGTGFNRKNMTEYYGALSVYQYYGMPLYLKGSYCPENPTNQEYNSGGSIAFNYGSANEMNFIKLVAAYRLNSSTYDSVNIGATNNTTPPSTNPGVENRFSKEQIREFRFRAVSYNASAPNTGLESTGEFSKYFTSPSVVGADWFNVYSNAIFFSFQGDGKTTSFTEHGDTWLGNTQGTFPIGIYYTPQTTNPGFQFVTSNNTNTARASALSLSRYATTTLNTKNLIVNADEDITLNADANILIEAAQTIELKAPGVYLSNTFTDITSSAYITVATPILQVQATTTALTGTTVTIGSTTTNISASSVVNVTGNGFKVDNSWTNIYSSSIWIGELQPYVELQAQYGTGYVSVAGAHSRIELHNASAGTLGALAIYGDLNGIGIYSGGHFLIQANPFYIKGLSTHNDSIGVHMAEEVAVRLSYYNLLAIEKSTGALIQLDFHRE